MATIGLDHLVFAEITENSVGEEVFGTPEILAEAISADVSVELLEAILHADDKPSESVKEFKNGKISLGINDLGKTKASRLLGAKIDSNGVLISSGENQPKPVAIGFRARKSNGNFRYFWFYRVVFGIPGTNAQTKGDSINFATPTIEGTIYQRKKADINLDHPWKAEVTEGEGTITKSSSVVTNWFNSVYEPGAAVSFGEALSTLTLTNVTLNQPFSPDIVEYTGSTTSSSSAVTFTPADSSASAFAMLNETTYKTSGASYSFASGENSIKIVVHNGLKARVYKLTITKS